MRLQFFQEIKSSYLMTSTTKVNAVKNFNLRSEKETNTPLNHLGRKFHSHLRELKNKDKK